MRRNIKKMYLITILKNLGFFAPISIAFFTQWGGLSFTQIMILQTFFMLWGFIMEVPAGVVADVIGRKQSIIIGTLIEGTGLIIYGSIPNFTIFMLGEFLIASGYAFISGADKALVYDSLKTTGDVESASKVFGRIKATGAVGHIIAPIIGSIVARTIGLNIPLILMGIAEFIAIIVAITLKEPVKEIKTKMKDYLKITKKGFKTILKHKTLRILTIDFVLATSLFTFIHWFWQPSLERVGVDIAYFGLVAALFNLSSMLLLTKVKDIERLLGIKRTILSAGILSSVSIIALGIINNWVIIILSIVLIYSLKSIREPIYQHYMNMFIDSDVRATTLSSISMIRKLIITITYPIIGLLMDLNIQFTIIMLGSLMMLLTVTTRVSKELVQSKNL